MQKHRTPANLPLICSPVSMRNIFADLKWQTRRAVKLTKWATQHETIIQNDIRQDAEWVWTIVQMANVSGAILREAKIRCPYGQPGDLLWTREPLQRYDDGSNRGLVQYVSDGKIVDSPWRHRVKYLLARWMPREFSRLTVVNKDVRVERVQAITEDDARAEGCEPMPYIPNTMWIASPANAMRRIRRFKRLWDSEFKARDLGWDANPLVWVVTFAKMDAETTIPARDLTLNASGDVQTHETTDNAAQLAGTETV